MKKRKVFKLINSLQPKEKRKLDRWLEYELSDKQQAVHDLYRLLIKDAKLNVVWEALFPDRKMPAQALQDQQLRRLENHLTERISTFIAIEQFRKDESIRDLYLIKALNERPQLDAFVSEFNKVKRRLESKAVKNSEYYQALYLLEKEYQYFRVKSQPKNYRIPEEYDELLDIWWMHEKMRLANVYLPVGQPNYFPQEGSSLAFAMQLIDNEERYQNMPMLQIYLQQFRLHTQDAENHDIPEWLWTYGSWMQPKEKRDMLVNLTNYYVHKTNQTGEMYYRQQAYLLMRWGIDSKITLLDGYLPWNTYHILCTLIFQFEELEASRILIEQYKTLLPEADQEPIYAFQLAGYYFRKQQYRRTIQTLNQRYKYPSIEKSARTFILLARYEIGERIELENEIRALKVWINRQEGLTPTIKFSSILFLKLFEALIIAYQVIDFNELLQKVEEAKNISNRDWLKKQIQAKMRLHQA
ncbi:MAG: hypothetical protein AB8H47_31280 [Bacteroidia bacterium]